MWLNFAILALACVAPAMFIGGGIFVMSVLMWFGRKRREARERAKVKHE